MAPRKKAEAAPGDSARRMRQAKKTPMEKLEPRKRAAAPADASMNEDTTTSTPGNRTVCKTCNGHGATDLVPMNARNTEAHYNKYGQSLKLGVAGGSHMGATCVGCSGVGMAK